MMKIFVAAFFCLAAIHSMPAQKLSPLAPAPDWNRLERFQKTMTREDFAALLDSVYAPDAAYRDFIEIGENSATIKKTAEAGDVFELRFAKLNEAKTPPAHKKSLRGLKIAIDPGHLGGTWAKMEERWFQIGAAPPVTEGDMTLRVSRLIAAQLGALGAEVLLVRNSAAPVTSRRPEDLRDVAIAELKLQGVADIREKYDGPNDPLKHNSIQWESELLFYRVSEIRARAAVVNRVLKPDLVLCLHFNAEKWGDPTAPELVEKNHFHLLINGCYAAGELALDDVRFEMLSRLLSRVYDRELAVSRQVATAIANATGLPPYDYTTDNARRVAETEYIWTRNLLANRLYRCPVVYIEPYVMNSQAVFDRVQLGDYEGEREIGGMMRKSIFREYADAVVDGLRGFYGSGPVER